LNTKRLIHTGIFGALTIILVTACATPTPFVVEVPVTGPTATREVVVVTATPGASVTSKPLNPIAATAQALAQSITLVPPTRGPQPDDYEGMLEQAWNLINANYYSDQFNGHDWPAILEEFRPRFAAAQSQQEFWGLMDEFVGSLGDSHSNFRTPADVSARYGGGSGGAGRAWTGIDMWPPPGHLDGNLALFDVCRIGPAASAGLQRGDHVLAISGEPVVLDKTTDLDALVLRVMFGDEGDSSVTLTVQQGPNAAPRDVKLNLGGGAECGDWTSEIVSTNPRIGYIRIPDFDSGSDTVLLDLINELEEAAPLDGLMLDIRQNPGGNSDADIAIFTQGTFGTVGPKREGKSRPIYKIRGPVKWNETTPVVLLTNESSHSAADYFAVAMKLSGRATLVGMPTAGNTDGWTSFTMPDGSQIGIAVMILELPDGSSIEGIGVQPDIMVRSDDWGMRDTPDIQFQTGLNFLLSQ
jgi:C-terminal peptidase prc